MWWIQPLEVAENEKGTGRWRLTAKSDEGGGGPFGKSDHDHASAQEAQSCTQCIEFCNQIAGMPGVLTRKEEPAPEQDEELLQLVEDTASMLRGMQFDPAIPIHAKGAMLSRALELEAAVRSHIDY